MQCVIVGPFRVGHACSTSTSSLGEVALREVASLAQIDCIFRFVFYIYIHNFFVWFVFVVVELMSILYENLYLGCLTTNYYSNRNSNSISIYTHWLIWESLHMIWKAHIIEAQVLIMLCMNGTIWSNWTTKMVAKLIHKRMCLLSLRFFMHKCSFWGRSAHFQFILSKTNLIKRNELIHQPLDIFYNHFCMGCMHLCSLYTNRVWHIYIQSISSMCLFGGLH